VSRPLLLGIDDGTTAVKASLFDLDLRVVAEARRPVRSHHPQPGWVQQDPLEVLDAVVATVAEVLADAPGEVVACGLDHQGESVLAWDAETGTPLSPIVAWQCRRSQPVIDRLAAAGEEPEIRRISGLPLDPYFSASKLTWLLEDDPALRAAVAAGAARLGTVDAFLSDRLGAGFATDSSTASRTQLYALGEDRWSPALCERFGVPVAALPVITDSAGALGELRHDRWPVAPALTARLCDQQAALAGAGCVAPGRVKASYGTGVFVLAHVGATRPDAGAALLPTVAWRIDGTVEYALDGGVFTAGALLEWLARDLGIADDPEGVSALAATVDDSAGARVLPALAGLGAPWWRPEARGVIAGLTAAAGRAHVARAALEGIAWRVADIVAAVDALTPVASLRVDGGLTNSPLLLQLQADALGVPVERGAVDATVAGVAAMAGVGAGRFTSTAGLADRLAVSARVTPRRTGEWRAAEHAAWRGFVTAAADLSG
jgi:glycerol kinase